MVSNSLTQHELQNCCDEIIDRVKESIKRRRELFNNGSISLADSLLISDQESAMLNTANQAAILVISAVLTDMATPGKLLDAVIDDLQAVIQKLRNLSQFLSMFAGLINVFKQIIAAAAGSPGAVAAIGPLISQIQTFIKTI